MQPGLQPFTNTKEGRARASELGKKGVAKREQNRANKRDALAQLEQAADIANQADNIPDATAAAILHTIHRVNTGDLPLDPNRIPEYLLALNTINRLATGQATTHTATTTITQQQTSNRLKALQQSNTQPPNKP